MNTLQRSLAAGALALAGPAWAGPGDHIQAGPAEIVPSIALGFEAWSNAYLSQGERATGNAGDAGQLGINFFLSPALDVNVNHEKVRFKFEGAYFLRKFFQPDIAADLDRFSDFDAGFRLDILPKGVVGVYLADKARLRNQASDVASYDGSLITRLQNSLGGGLNFRFGPGIELSPGVDWNYQLVRVPAVTGQQPYNNLSVVSPKLDLHWRFFPSTMYILEAQYDLNRWSENFVESSGGALGDFIGIPDSDFFKARTGLRGRITRHLILTVTAGYGFGDYKDDSVADAAGGNAEADPTGEGYGQDVKALDAFLATVKFGIDLGHSERKTFGQLITLRYVKDFDDSFFTNYVAYNDIGASLDSRWGRFLGSRLQGGVRFENYQGEVSRKDTFIVAGGHLAVIPAKWMDISVGATWNQRASDDDSVEYDNVIGSLVARFTY